MLKNACLGLFFVLACLGTVTALETNLYISLTLENRSNTLDLNQHNITVTISTMDSCSEGIFANHTFLNAMTRGRASLNFSGLNDTLYNKVYYACYQVDGVLLQNRSSPIQIQGSLVNVSVINNTALGVFVNNSIFHNQAWNYSLIINQTNNTLRDLVLSRDFNTTQNITRLFNETFYVAENITRVNNRTLEITSNVSVNKQAILDNNLTLISRVDANTTQLKGELVSSNTTSKLQMETNITQVRAEALDYNSSNNAYTNLMILQNNNSVLTKITQSLVDNNNTLYSYITTQLFNNNQTLYSYISNQILLNNQSVNTYINSKSVGNITGQGNANVITKFSGTQTITNSSITDDGSRVVINANTDVGLLTNAKNLTVYGKTLSSTLEVQPGGNTVLTVDELNAEFSTDVQVSGLVNASQIRVRNNVQVSGLVNASRIIANSSISTNSLKTVNGSELSIEGNDVQDLRTYFKGTDAVISVSLQESLKKIQYSAENVLAGILGKLYSNTEKHTLKFYVSNGNFSNQELPITSGRSLLQVVTSYQGNTSEGNATELIFGVNQNKSSQFFPGFIEVNIANYSGNLVNQINITSENVTIQDLLIVPKICLDGVCQTVWTAGGGNITGIGSAGQMCVFTNATNIRATDEVVVAMNWSLLQNYPGACPAGEVVNQIGDSINCLSVGDINGVTAGTGLTGGGDTGVVTLTLNDSYVRNIFPYFINDTARVNMTKNFVLQGNQTILENLLITGSKSRLNLTGSDASMILGNQMGGYADERLYISGTTVSSKWYAQGGGNPTTFLFDVDAGNAIVGTTDNKPVDFIVSNDEQLHMTTTLTTISNEVNITSISGDGSGKVVCIKSDSTLGTCSSVVAADGTCTCS